MLGGQSRQQHNNHHETGGPTMNMAQTPGLKNYDESHTPHHALNPIDDHPVTPQILHE